MSQPFSMTVMFEYDDVPYIAEVLYTPAKPVKSAMVPVDPALGTPSKCEIVSLGLASVRLNGRYAPVGGLTLRDRQQIDDLVHDAADLQHESVKQLPHTI